MSESMVNAGGVSAPIVDSHARVDALERHILDNCQLVDQPVEHLFLPGLYVRKVFNPAGSLVITKIHKTEHPYFLLYGTMSIRNAATGETVLLEAPHTGVTQPGTRRIILAHTDVVFVTVHPNPDNTQDLDLIESRLIERRELEPGKTSHELFQERMRQIADGCRALAGIINPQLADDLPVDYDSIDSHSRELAEGIENEVPDEVQAQAMEHLRMFGLTLKEGGM